MKNIDNLRVLPLDLDIVIDWSPARELWKILRDDVMSSLWKHVHLSRLIRFETYKKPIIIMTLNLDCLGCGSLEDSTWILICWSSRTYWLHLEIVLSSHSKTFIQKLDLGAQ